MSVARTGRRRGGRGLSPRLPALQTGCVIYKAASVAGAAKENFTFLPGGWSAEQSSSLRRLGLSSQHAKKALFPQVTSWFRSATEQLCLKPHLPAASTVTKPSTMMQISSDSASNKHSLINVMHRFIAAANNMDETIMVPSLLRDMPLEEQQQQQHQQQQQQQQQQQAAAGQVEANNNESPCPNKQQRDMYEHYLLLKSIKNDMEWGLLKREMSSGASFLEMAVKQEEQQPVTGDTLLLDENSDLEHQFHYHLRGLFGVLSKLTLQADHLTNRYKREIGGGNFMR